MFPVKNLARKGLRVITIYISSMIYETSMNTYIVSSHKWDQTGKNYILSCMISKDLKGQSWNHSHYTGFDVNKRITYCMQIEI